MSLIHDLRDLAVSIRTDEQAAGFFVWKDVPFTDFNRQIVEPGTNPDFPSGALGIYSDDDFYAVASLPYRFKDLSCAEIVATLWPEIENPVILPDHGDYWWTAQRDDKLEVPGEPWEMWFVESARGAIPDNVALQTPHCVPEADSDGRPAKYDAVRWRTCATEEEALKARSSIGGSVYREDFENLSIEIRHWDQGVRTIIHKLGVDPEKFTIIETPKETDIYKRLGLTDTALERENT
ncbi:hypothetical protein [Mesorhizobium sp. SP-1A]|uniref:hypothetical protein n=1 Tax=Mesorhizobium sp. SP-1A TaxID=3077840 RepID=UPI0028F6C0F7|nr:hypothetical protein [Mesorhizobium sp. SP-1A]